MQHTIGDSSFAKYHAPRSIAALQERAAFTKIENIVVFDLEQSMIGNPQKLQETLDALEKIYLLKKEFRLKWLQSPPKTPESNNIWHSLL